MKEDQADYLRFAAAARVEAASAPLEQVRQKHLLSAATWDGLAHFAQKVSEARAQRAIERSALLQDGSVPLAMVRTDLVPSSLLVGE